MVDMAPLTLKMLLNVEWQLGRQQILQQDPDSPLKRYGAAFTALLPLAIETEHKAQPFRDDFEAMALLQALPNRLHARYKISPSAFLARPLPLRLTSAISAFQAFR